jgi:hypothetical protein
MTQSTCETAAVPTIDAYEENPFLTGNFGPIDFETTAYVMLFKGQIPMVLTGRLVRIGPNPSNAMDVTHHHWFNGMGMLHGVRMINAGSTAESIGLGRLPGNKSESDQEGILYRRSIGKVGGLIIDSPADACLS